MTAWTCLTCDGLGWIQTATTIGDRITYTITTCPDCETQP